MSIQPFPILRTSSGLLPLAVSFCLVCGIFILLIAGAAVGGTDLIGW